MTKEEFVSRLEALIAEYNERKPDIAFGKFTDPRDGRTYKTVQIGSQTWLAENLAFDYAGSKCYEDDLERAEENGRLYDWETAQKACPEGWHIPTDKEWQQLFDFVGDNPGKKLKAKDGWEDGGNGTDDFGFSALPGGYSDGSSFDDVGDVGFWWSATENGTYNAWCRYMYSGNANVFRYNYNKSNLHSVRCVQD